MRQIIFGLLLVLIVFVGALFTPAHAADKQLTPRFENEQLSLRLFPRSTEQMAGFFEARGFPIAMIQRLSGYCFFTVVIENKMNKQLRLDLSGWTFSTDQQPLSRMPRKKWPPIWKALHIPQASQATFRWTLLPEILHFYANESEGGNIILQKTNRPIVLRAEFGVGKGDDTLLVTVDGLRCVDAAKAAQ